MLNRRKFLGFGAILGSFFATEALASGATKFGFTKPKKADIVASEINSTLERFMFDKINSRTKTSLQKEIQETVTSLKIRKEIDNHLRTDIHLVTDESITVTVVYTHKTTFTPQSIVSVMTKKGIQTTEYKIPSWIDA